MTFISKYKNIFNCIVVACIISLLFYLFYFFFINKNLKSKEIYSQVIDYQNIILSNVKDSTNVFPTWIWYPGDFEIELYSRFVMQRTQKGIAVPPVTRIDNYYPNVQFKKEIDIISSETIEVYCNGVYNLQLDGNFVYNNSGKFNISSGKHNILISVFNNKSLPTIFVKGTTIKSDSSWLVSCYDKKWFTAGYWNFNSLENLPSAFKLPTIEVKPYKIIKNNNKLFVDFGKETFGFLKFKKSGKGFLRVNYGESEEEANSDDCETFDIFTFNEGEEVFINKESRGFRFAKLIHKNDLLIDSVALLFEYLPLKKKGDFKCSNQKLNNIYETSVYTLQLNSREFFIDGIKRDRWAWSGDAVQNYLLNYYLYFDKEINKRTIIALRGKDPVESHINTILDYSFYWIISIYDYYIYTGDIRFIKQIYPKMITLMDFCLNRRNENGFMEGKADDWVFIDWADIDKTGENCAVQILLWKSLQTMTFFADILNDNENHIKYLNISNKLKSNINNVFWSNEKQSYVHSRKNNKINNYVTGYANYMAIYYDFVDSLQKNKIFNNVLIKEEEPVIKTPFMKFYKLSAKAECEMYSDVISEINDYWGAMLDLGATTFWESFDSNEKGMQHFSNGHPDRPFARSLCHSWAAGPIYIFGKYILGVKPILPAYEKFNIQPNLAGLDYITGVVPLPNGSVEIYADKEKIKIYTDCNGGTLFFKSKIKPQSNFGKINQMSSGLYFLTIEKNKYYVVKIVS